MNTKILGNAGENLAAAYLENHGYRILERNYRCKQGEIDIIAQKCDVLVFIEVKTRRTLRYGTPGAAVDYKNSRELSAALHGIYVAGMYICTAGLMWWRF